MHSILLRMYMLFETLAAAQCLTLPYLENVQPINDTSDSNGFGYGFTFALYAEPGFRFLDGRNETEMMCASSFWEGAQNASGLCRL